MSNLQEYIKKNYQKGIAECSNEELYIALLNYTKLAKSTYYDALKKLSREDKYKGLKTLIHNICNKNHGRYFSAWSQSTVISSFIWP